MFIRSTGEPFLAQVVGHSEHGDAYRRITYDHDGKTVLHDCASVRRLSLPRAPSPPRVYGGGAVPQGGVGDRHLVTIPQGVVGDRLPWGGERQGGGGVPSQSYLWSTPSAAAAPPGLVASLVTINVSFLRFTYVWLDSPSERASMHFMVCPPRHDSCVVMMVMVMMMAVVMLVVLWWCWC